MVLGLMLPNAALKLLHYQDGLLSGILDVSAAVVLGSATIYTARQIKGLSRIIRPVLFGFSLLLLWQISKSFEFTSLVRGRLGQPWCDIYQHVLESSMLGVGMLLFGGGFFYTIVELLGARDERLEEHQRLVNETAQRARTERALRDNESVFRAITMAANEGIIVVSPSGRVEFWNPRAAYLLGCDEKGVLDIPSWRDLFPPDDYARIQSRLEACKQDGGLAKTTETSLKRRDGAAIDVELSVATVDLEGKPHLLNVFRDITERKRAEQTIARQRMQIINAARLSSLGVMASGVAHEVNNPLAVISVASEQLAREFGNEPVDIHQMERLISSISRNVERIEGIVRGLRQLSRDGARDPFQRVSVSTIVGDTLELCRARFNHHGIALDIRTPVEDTDIECRPAQLSQVLLNLLHNAYDAVENSSSKWVRLEVLNYGDVVEFSVTDSGCGVAPEIAHRLVEPFFTTKAVGRGMGLGLSLTKSIVDAHGGEFHLDETCPNTRFCFRLPRHQPQQPTRKGVFV